MIVVHKRTETHGMGKDGKERVGEGGQGGEGGTGKNELLSEPSSDSSSLPLSFLHSFYCTFLFLTSLSSHTADLFRRPLGEKRNGVLPWAGGRGLRG
jgi:hypothetical protein